MPVLAMMMKAPRSFYPHLPSGISRVGLNEAFTALTPLFSLFADGYYRLEERELYPTDGNGHFFWAVGNEKQPNPATTGRWIADVDYHYQSGEPCFYCRPAPIAI